MPLIRRAFARCKVRRFVVAVEQQLLERLTGVVADPRPGQRMVLDTLRRDAVARGVDELDVKRPSSVRQKTRRLAVKRVLVVRASQERQVELAVQRRRDPVKGCSCRERG